MCIRDSGECVLQELAHRLGVQTIRFKNTREYHELDTSSPSLVRDPNKCIPVSYTHLDVYKRQGYLRKSVVKDPVRRGNTGDNTPAMIYTEIVPGDKVKITVRCV